MNEIILGVTYPACNLSPKIFAQAQKRLKKHGIILKNSTLTLDHNLAPFRYSAEYRAKELEAFFQDSSINAIICARGGYGCQHLLKYLDFNIIKQNPKIFIAYSDASILLNQIQQNTGLITQHGPMVRDLARITNTSFFNKFRKNILSNFKNMPLYNLSKCEIIQAGTAEGILVGGNLSSLCSLIGTPYEINLSHKILFLEDVGEEFYHIDRLISHLVLNKKILQTKAIIFGDFSRMTNKELRYKANLKTIILELLKDYKNPIIWNFPAGHQNNSNFLPIGQKIKISFHNNQKLLKFS